MSQSSTLTRSDYEDYLVHLYFGSDDDLRYACIRRAYRDLNRTMHGFGNLENKERSKSTAEKILWDSLDELRSLATRPMTETVFDAWHKKACESLISHFRKNHFHFYVGQAQKWINMTLKYMFTLGEERVQGYVFVHPFCHAPLDKILMARLEAYEFPRLSSAWSRLDDYDEYLEKQNWIRRKFSIAPLDVEFLLWMGKEIIHP